MLNGDGGGAFAVWLTGLPGSGKTTLAGVLAIEFAARGLRTQTLDGDDLRKRVSADLGFSRVDRDEHVRRVSQLARQLLDAGTIPLIALVSPFRQARQEARRVLGRVVEVYVMCPVNVLVERDPKGLYRRALAGEVANFTGISDPYEPPDSPDVVVDTSRESVEASKRRVLEYLQKHGYLS